MMDSIEDRLVRFTDSFAFDDIEPKVLHAIKLRFIDTIGCALAGYNEEPAKIARNLAAADPQHRRSRCDRHEL